MRASEIQPKKLVVFDIDDTLVNTQTKVHVVKDGQVVNSLNSHDFTHYKLKPGESFDFEDFRNAREFFEKSKPIIPMMRKLKQDIATGNKVVMVTARADFDDKELFLDTFRKYGVDIDKVHVYRAGNSKQGTTEERKKAIIKNLLDKDNYSKAIMYDDAKPNLHTFIELKQDHPKTKFYAWHVSPEGAASEYMREGMVSEKKKRKRKPRWAAYGPGPYGGYGYAVGYSGDSGGEGGVGENFANESNSKYSLKNMFGDVKSLDNLSLEQLNKAMDGHVKIVGRKFRSQEGRSFTYDVKLDNGNWYIMHIVYVYGIIDAWLTDDNNNKIPLSKLKKQGVEENFADGKVKGKSRPGRVKRAGASCSGSVTDLRKRAKNASGEKAKMYHWCANMKSGRNK